MITFHNLAAASAQYKRPAGGEMIATLNPPAMWVWTGMGWIEHRGPGVVDSHSAAKAIVNIKIKEDNGMSPLERLIEALERDDPSDIEAIRDDIARLRADLMALDVKLTGKLAETNKRFLGDEEFSPAEVMLSLKSLLVRVASLEAERFDDEIARGDYD